MTAVKILIHIVVLLWAVAVPVAPTAAQQLLGPRGAPCQCEGCPGTETELVRTGLYQGRPPSGSPPGTITVAKFDPALGTLVKVRYVATVEVPFAQARFENTNPVASCELLGMVFALSLQLKDPFGTNLTFGPGASIASVFDCSQTFGSPINLAPFDQTPGSQPDFAGASATTVGCPAASARNSNPVAYCSDRSQLDSFIGAPGGTVPFLLSSIAAQSQSTTCSNLASSFVSQAKVTVTVTYTYCPNKPPTGLPDTAETCARTPVEIPVLANDCDIDGKIDCSSITIVDQPDNGANVSVTGCAGVSSLTGCPQANNCPGCRVTYTPNTGFSGTDTFKYTVKDDDGCESDDVTVTVTVNPAPTAVNDALTTCAGTAKQLNVLVNDSAGAGASFNCATLTVTGPPAGQGTVTKVNCTGATCTSCVLEYSPGAFVGATSFSYTVTNSFGCSAQGTVNVTVTPNPVANPDTLTTCAGVAKQLNVLVNDSAGAGASFNCATLTVTGPAAGQGTVTKVNCTGATCTSCVLEYSPGAFVGATSFSYTVTNSVGCSAQGTVNVTVSPNPVVNPDTLTTCAGVAKQLNVLGNDSAGAGASFNCATLTVTGPRAGQGTVTKVNCTGATCTSCVLEYSPGAFVGATSFSYTVTNSVGCSAQATVSVTVSPNPVANPDTLTTCAGVAKQLNVLVNDSAGAGASFNCATLTVTGPAAGQGTVTKVNCTGATCTSCVLEYSPGAFVGATSFSYTVTNSFGCTDDATVSVTVSPNPVANPDTLTTCAGVAKQLNVLVNDSAGAGASFNCATLTVTGPAAGQGTVTKVNCTGATCTSCVLEYSPGAFVGATSFSYTVTNSFGCSDEATVNVTVSPNPVANPDTLTTCAGTAKQLNVLVNDSAGAGASFNCATLTVTGPPAGQGTVTKVNCTGATCTSCVLEYSPGAFVGATSFSYTVTNSFGCLDDATVNVTVNPNPVANPDTLTTCAGSAKQLNVLVNDSAGAGASFNCATLTVTGPPAGQGTVTKVNCTGETCTSCVLEYSPGAFVGATSFSYTVTNSFGCLDDATVSVTVNPNPVANPDTLTTCAGSAKQLNVLVNDSAGAGASFNCATLTVTGPPAGQGTVTKVNCTGATCTSCVLEYSPGAFVGATSFSYTVTNSFGCLDDATVSVTVNPNPLANPDTLTTCAGVAKQLDVLGNDSAGAGASFNCATLTVTGPAAGQGTVTKVNCTGATCTSCVLEYSPGAFVGATSFSYTVTNSFGCSDDATVNVTVSPNPVANPDTLTTCAGVAKQLNVLVNDSAGAGASFNCATLTVTGPAAGQGTVTKVNCTGATCTSCVLEYSPGAFVGATSFSYTVTNSFGCLDDATVNVTVNPNPLANPDTLTTCAGSAKQLDVLVNDSAGAGASFNCATLTVTGPPAGQGTVTKVNCTGATCTSCVLEYSPGAFVGATSFSYTVTNSFGCLDDATVSVTVNPNPLANPDTLTTCAGSTKQLDVLANDSAGAGASFNCATLTVTGPPAGQGTVTKVNCTGATCTSCVLQYSPGAFVGATSFSYTVTNSFGCSDDATVSVRVCAPTAQPDSAVVCQLQSVPINVLANDSSQDACSPINCGSITIVDAPEFGIAVPNGSCTGSACASCRVVYTHNDPDHTGPDTFRYTIKDTAGCVSAPVTVTIQVRPSPRVIDRKVIKDPLSTSPIANIPVLDGATPGQGCTLVVASVTIVTPPAFGTAVVNANGTVTYTPASNFPDEDTFCFRVQNSCGCFDEGCVEINEPPITCIERNRRQCGSLLLYPEFSTRPGEMTMFTITDACCAAPGPSTYVEFIFIKSGSCLEENRTFLLTPCDTLTFITNTSISPNQRGYAYAFAKSASAPGTTPKVFNHLIGELLFLDGMGQLQYAMNAVSFKGIGTEGSLNDEDNDGVLDLDGLTEYEEAPDKILVPRFFGQDANNKSELILVALSGGTAFKTNGGTEVLFAVFDDNEHMFSFTHEFYCWEKRPLTELSGAFLQSFLHNDQSPIDDPDEIFGWTNREAGWFTIDGLRAHSPAETINDPAIYAVLVERWDNRSAAELPFEYCSQINGDLLPTGVFGDPRLGFPSGLPDDDQ